MPVPADADPLWHRLRAWSPDDPAASFSFTRRLARDNDWPLDFARRVVEEYRRFAFLAMRAGHRVTPSDEVDQAWHLHLCYTRDYWHTFCGEVLQADLHHGPTKGGASEAGKFDDWYARTRDSYARWFGHAPPRDLWPDASERFGRRGWRRVDTDRFWLVPRAAAKRTAAAAVLVALALGSLALAGDDDGHPWACYIFVAIVLVAFVIRGLIRRHNRRRSGDATGGATGGGLFVDFFGSDGESDGDSGCGGCGGCGD